MTALERSHYEVFGVAPGATTEEIHARYVAKVRMLDPSCHAGADPEVLVLARRAQERLHQAWKTLRDASSRRCYDEMLGEASDGHQEPENSLGHPPLSSPSWANIPAPSGRLGALLAVPAAVADWLAPRPHRPRKVVVPEFLTMNVSQTSVIALRADVRLQVVRLTENPAPTDGIVVDQDPSPGTTVRRGSTVRLPVLHPRHDAPTRCFGFSG